MFKKLFIIMTCIALILATICTYLFINNSNLKTDKAEQKETIAQQEEQIQNEVQKAQTKPELDVINFNNANSRETYFTLHKVAAAQKISKGKGIKVGILDHSFAMEKHKDLYAGGEDFTGNINLLNSAEWHGFWMASVLKEIAPECSIYALCTYDFYSEDKKVENMINAINWAVKNKIDILTYSAEQFSEQNRKKIDAAVDYAVKSGVVISFINYDNPNNLWPDGMFPLKYIKLSKDSREPDLNILQYDYNTLFVKNYIKSLSADENQNSQKSGDDIPYLSISSTSPVTAGFVAILKSINNTLTPEAYKDILIKTSYSTDFYDWNFKRNSHCTRVADIEKAAKYMVEKYKK